MYNKVLSISNELSNKAIHQFNCDKVVRQPSMKVGLFTIVAIDNIDHNPNMNTAATLFHDTAISLSRHASIGEGLEREVPFTENKQK